jgi:hypothetical protein
MRLLIGSGRVEPSGGDLKTQARTDRTFETQQLAQTKVFNFLKRSNTLARSAAPSVVVSRTPHEPLA